MIDFNKIQITDKTWMKPLIAAADMEGCHQNFTNLFVWAEINNYVAAHINNYLIIQADNVCNEPYYLYPAGTGDIKQVIDLMIQDAADRGHQFKFAGLSKENISTLEILYPNNFTYEENREIFDYVYSLDKLVTLSGKKLHAKRNHINYFKDNFNWKFELINLENLSECWDMNVQWCIKNGCDEDSHLSEEYCAVKRSFDNFSDLELEGGLLRVDGEIVAYTIGEKLNSTTYVIHIEKAFSDVRGAYQMINREFAEIIQKKYPDIIFVNREEDMGYEGLRKAKSSYYPIKMTEKYTGNYSLVK